MTPETPFDPAHSTRFFVETTIALEALQRLDRGLGAREPFLLVTGEPGTGKTALAHEAITRWGSRVAAVSLAYPTLSGTELLEEILRRLGAEPPEGASRSRLMSLLERTIGEITSPGQIAIVVVDDAHQLSAEALEDLRMLVNALQQTHRLIEVLLIGLPALEARLDEPAFAAIRQRVAARVKTAPLPAADIERYVQHRVAVTGGDGAATFPQRSCGEIAQLTKGVPRQINALAAEALNRCAESGAKSVTPAHVQAGAFALWGIAPRGVVEEPPAAREPVAQPPVVAPPPPVTPRPAAPAPPPPPVEKKPAAVAPEPPPPPPPVAMKPAAPTPPPVERKPAAVAPEPPPPPAPVAKKPARVTPPSPRDEESLQTYGPTVTHHDPDEWVKRFVGEKGPLEIGSRSAEVPTWDLDYLDGPTPAPAGEQKTPSPPPAKSKSKPRVSKSRFVAPRIDVGRIAAIAAGSVAIIAVLVLIIRAGGQMGARAAQAKAASATADSVKAALSTGSRASEGTKASAASPKRATSKSRSKQPFTIEVGSYETFDRAYEERDRMQQLTGIDGWVISPDEGGQPYRVVLGMFRNEDRAVGAANMLLNSRTLRRATVVPLPPRDSRN